MTDNKLNMKYTNALLSYPKRNRRHSRKPILTAVVLGLLVLASSLVFHDSHQVVDQIIYMLPK